MKKKYQVFISSTYSDLIDERQMAVEAVLNAGHIPAGMELFKSGDKTQKEVIKKWIEDSDVYFLILGGRYGSIDFETGLSYTHWEYEYATTLKKPIFSVVISNQYLDKKVKSMGLAATDGYRENYEEFRDKVLSKVSRFFDDLKDIKITILESLQELASDDKVEGWVSSKEIGSFEKIQTENSKLKTKLLKEEEKNKKLEEKLSTVKSNQIGEFSYEEIKGVLRQTFIDIPVDAEGKVEKIDCHRLFVNASDSFNIGIDNAAGMGVADKILFFEVAPRLLNFNLIAVDKLPNRMQRVRATKDGLKYLAMTEVRKLKKTTTY
ncbi:DUF4062 domain-containing protein [Listeria rustica]|uniref:DUF4062 domain-containing protein n=1 Tax=Listeria rustica TaxID=2713503 RepID=A0A7W1YHK1_9LIST|nr:DUF4062 domain-containing protein [Listeria rustica]MBA3927724.1 DUF4062 domain-containing protein [Listeria rustica]